MQSTFEESPRTYVIQRHPILGYGFVAGHELPTVVKMIEPNGPSHKRLLPGDVIMAVNGIDVQNVPREQIVKMIQLCGDQIEIKVRQPTYEELIRSRNLADPKLYTLNKSNSSSGNNLSLARPPISPPTTQSGMKLLVTPSVHKQHPGQHLTMRKLSTSSPLSNGNGETPPVQINHSANPQAVLRQKPNNGTEQDDRNDFTKTLGRSHSKFGRHSPLPQRCKSSMDVSQKNGSKKPGDEDNDQPLLKRSNTMRPIKPPDKVLKMLEVVIKVFFEDGHTRVLKYNQYTTVGTIVETLNTRLVGSSPHAEQIKGYFGLALTVGVQSENGPKDLPKRKLLHILDENDSIMKIRHLPYAPKLRLLYRMVYPPSDVYTLYSQDKAAFEYLYQQSCNDLKLERFQSELDPETALKLSALHLLEYVHSNFSKSHGNSKDPKVYTKLIKKSPGIEFFLPASMVETIIDKKGKRIVSAYKKMRARLTEQVRKCLEEFDFELPKVKSTTNLNRYSSTSFHELYLPEMQNSPSEYIKLVFLNHLSQMPFYGNSKRPVRTSASPIDRNSAGDCSSSLESVPRTSDSSPLIKQDRVHNGNGLNGNVRQENVSRMAQMNSMRSLSSVQSSSISQPMDRRDMAQTPSIESLSSITFNIQNSPSPQQAPSYMSQASSHFYNQSSGLPSQGQPIMTSGYTKMEPSPMPRQQICKSVEKLHTQRDRPIEELLRRVIILPPPPPPLSMINFSEPYHIMNGKIQSRPSCHLTRVLTDHDLEKLRVPPPPRMID